MVCVEYTRWRQAFCRWAVRRRGVVAAVGGGVERTRLGIFPLSLTGQEDKALGLGWLEREAGWAPYVGERESAGESVRWQRKFWPDDWARFVGGRTWTGRIFLLVQRVH